jgi:hypothetical protein
MGSGPAPVCSAQCTRLCDVEWLLLLAACWRLDGWRTPGLIGLID